MLTKEQEKAKRAWAEAEAARLSLDFDTEISAVDVLLSETLRSPPGEPPAAGERGVK